jgi:hypothetical protein
LVLNGPQELQLVADADGLDPTNDMEVNKASVVDTVQLLKRGPHAEDANPIGEVLRIGSSRLH